LFRVFGASNARDDIVCADAFCCNRGDEICFIVRSDSDENITFGDVSLALYDGKRAGAENTRNIVRTDHAFETLFVQLNQRDLMVLKTKVATDHFPNFACARDDDFHNVATPFSIDNLQDLSIIQKV
jgi:hypothetical protein